MALKTFEYENCLDRKYDDNDQIIYSVMFDISRYGQYRHIIRFENPVTEQYAIEKVESYLSEPLTPNHLEKIRDDLFAPIQKYSFDELQEKEGYTIQGDCLSDCKFLERCNINNGMLVLSCGS